MSSAIDVTTGQAPDGGTAVLEGVTDNAVFGSMSGRGFIASDGATTLVERCPLPLLVDDDPRPKRVGRQRESRMVASA